MSHPVIPGPATAAARPLDDPATLRALAARLREGVYVADAAGRLLDANPALASLLGAPDAAALLGRSLDALVADPAARRAALAGLGAAGGDSAGGHPAGGHRARDVDVELVGLDGVRRPVVESVSVMPGPDGAPRYLGIVLPLALAVADAATAAAPDAAAGDGAAHDGAADGAPLLAGAGRTQGAPALGSRAVTGPRDPLTGVLARAHLDALAAALAADRTPAGAILVRLEFARATLSTAAWDAMRQRTVRFLMRHVRDDEPIVRVAEDDFLIVLADTRPEHTERVARRVQLLALREAPVPLSLGWATGEPGESLEGVVARALAARVPVPHAARGREGDRRRAEHELLGLAATLIARDLGTATRAGSW